MYLLPLSEPFLNKLIKVMRHFDKDIPFKRVAIFGFPPVFDNRIAQGFGTVCSKPTDLPRSAF